MKKTHDLAVVTGTYEKDGQTKKRYLNVGVILEGENGPMILLDKHFNPAGVDGRDGRIVVSMFAATRQQNNYNRNDLDDEIPF